MTHGFVRNPQRSRMTMMFSEWILRAKSTLRPPPQSDTCAIGVVRGSKKSWLGNISKAWTALQYKLYPECSPHADRRGFDALSEYSPDILDKYLNRSKFDNPLIYRQLKGITAPLQALSTAVEGGSTTTTLQTQRMQGTLPSFSQKHEFDFDYDNVKVTPYAKSSKLALNQASKTSASTRGHNPFPGPSATNPKPSTPLALPEDQMAQETRAFNTINSGGSH
ncbi:hypothetical protein N7537_004644 [Penicillium hordei]|uniref:Uncharacterized protein n=1 Tax=Penicillium hordei TaxID=40994 RepID=A0AAD6H6A6_9EURO|nr:uncharacterized protein N7537_004644 [Penicillium hordei]KAJ5608025.1 hypothetical protein N7537_004644 [Penicillium hordei]